MSYIVVIKKVTPSDVASAMTVRAKKKEQALEVAFSEAEYLTKDLANRKIKSATVTLIKAVEHPVTSWLISRGGVERKHYKPNRRLSGLKGGKAKLASHVDVNPNELAIGIAEEMEHTDDPAIAKEIAMDHLVEDRHYYTKLKACGL